MPPLKLVDWNLRYDSKPDNITVQQSIASLSDPLKQPSSSNDSPEKPWSTSRMKVAQLIHQSEAVIAGFQEALIGVGRDNGVTAGEFNPIFFNKTFIRVLSWDTFWLSNTPFVPSKYSGAGSYRICTAARLSYTPPGSSSSPIQFTLLNTHLDERSDAQRRLGASLILTRAKFEAVNTGGVVIITGDFNSPASGSDSGAYSITTGAIPPVSIPADFAAKFYLPPSTQPTFRALDSRATTPAPQIAGNSTKFTGFPSSGQIQNGMGRIDFVFGDSLSKSRGLWTSPYHFVPAVLSDDGVLASDHRPVFVSLNIKNGTTSNDEDGDLPPILSGDVIA